MANTYSQIYLQFVFAVSNRESLIKKEWQADLYKYITGITQKNDHKLIAINGISDHIHILIGYNINQLIPELLQDIKGSSSLWVNKNKLCPKKFSWQSGYGVFSYSRSDLDSVCRYIKNQEKHHEKKSFCTEYLEFLDKYEVIYDEKFIFKNII